jgi:uncharacterized Zn finger protein
MLNMFRTKPASNALHFEVTGSDGDVYEVNAERSGATLSITCTCGAGQNGLHCKHRLALLSGDGRSLATPNPAGLRTLASWLPGSTLERQLSAVDQAQRDADLAAKRLSDAKRALGRMMSAG